MGRDRKYETGADRQRAYRQRVAQERAHRNQRKAVSVKLVKVLGLLGSDHPGERAAAALQATRILKEASLTWYDILDIEKP